MYRQLAFIGILSIWVSSLFGITIAEKKAMISGGSQSIEGPLQEQLAQVNDQLSESHREMRVLHKRARELYQRGALDDEYGELLDKMQGIRQEIAGVQEEWRQRVAGGGSDEGYTLWDAPETTLEQLIIDYGSSDFVYMIPAGIGELKVSVGSSLPIPRESWNEMLEWILGQYGVAIHQVNPFLRALYVVGNGVSHLATITNDRDDLDLYSANTRLCFVLDTQSPDTYRINSVLQRFSNEAFTQLQLIGSDIFVVGRVADIRELLEVYDFVVSHQGDRDYRIVTLRKSTGEEMSGILEAIFHQKVPDDGEKKGSLTGLQVITLKESPQSLFLLGTPSEVKKAMEVIAELESQLGEASEKTVFRYTCKHSEAEELAVVLEKVYSLMISSKLGGEEGAVGGADQAASSASSEEEKSSDVYQDGISIVVDPSAVDPSKEKKKRAASNRKNFIVDAKTGSIIMVIETRMLDRLRELIRRLDVPKKMVKIEVLLFEKNSNSQTDYGLNLAQMGDGTNGKNEQGASWQKETTSMAGVVSQAAGIFEYFFSRTSIGKAGPALDLRYRFLLSQEDIQINASPSVVTVNQTKAHIKLVEDRSISTGVVEFPSGAGSTSAKDSYSRAQFGITIDVTPTVHAQDGDDPFSDDFDDYITLETDIYFDKQAQGGTSDRPVFLRRNLKNEVRIADGQTVILGGLRQKDTTDGKKTIPFLGEIPGIGKLFSFTTSLDQTKELFIMLTPTIIRDPLTDFERLKREELTRRPGDVNEFLEQLEKAKEHDKRRLFEQSFRILLSETREPVQRRAHVGEYDGRA